MLIPQTTDKWLTTVVVATTAVTAVTLAVTSEGPVHLTNVGKRLHRSNAAAALSFLDTGP